MSLRAKLWLVVAVGIVAGVLDAYFDHVTSIFGYVRDAFIAALPAVITARFLYENRK